MTVQPEHTFGVSDAYQMYLQVYLWYSSKNGYDAEDVCRHLELYAEEQAYVRLTR